MKRKLFTLLLIASWVLGSYDGYIALYNQNCPQPLEIYPYKTQILPKTDQQALAEGIPVRDADQLTRLLQDFLS